MLTSKKKVSSIVVAFVVPMLLNVTTLVSQEVGFNRDVRPILARHCLACHGPDEGQRAAGLRFDIRDEALQVIEPGDPDSSELIFRISAGEDERMPPPEHGERLTSNEIELLNRWILQGANYETHWSFTPPTKPVPPTLAGYFKQWARTEIDTFVAEKLAELELHPSNDEEPRRLIRRLALDLTGLPPNKNQVDKFAASQDNITYESIVDELLIDPAYGEHWAAMWMDLARYADTTGYAEDKHRDIWPWRDWVIRAFDSNMAHDQFTIEQIAGDLLQYATNDQKLATAFHRNTLNNTEGGTSDEEFRVVAVKDRISTTLNVWMGVTLRCAECHSHKYDPISQKEYYQFFAFFNQTDDADTNNEKPLLDVFPAGRETQFAQLDLQIKELRKKTEAVSDTSDDGSETDQLGNLGKELDEAIQRRNSPIRVPVMIERKPENVRETHLMVRGSYLQPGEQVSAAVFESFHSLPNNATKNRMGVAQWLVSDQNPLTARVAVNRFWARVFGIGLVETEEDFGTQGTPPSNQKLLDWLAVDFQQNGWDIKRLLKQIVMSSTYRQCSAANDESLQKDPRNMFCSRGPRFRLTAEVVRDQALAVSGLLSQKRFGPPVYPSNPIKKVRSAFQGDTVWTESSGEDRYRRAIYTYLKRTSPHPLYETFDAATREVCNLRRLRTNTPLQSFMTLNDTTFVEASMALAARMYNFSDLSENQVNHGFELALFRPATKNESDELSDLFNSAYDEYSKSESEAEKLIEGIGQFGVDDESRKSETAKLAALTVVANVILNLDVFLTK